MRNSHRGAKILVALLATVGSLMATAAPASAATTLVTWTIAGHVLTHWNSITTVLGGDAGACDVEGGHPQVVTHVNDATHTTHITGSTAYSGFGSGTSNIGGTNYRVAISGANQTTTGSYNTTTNTMTQNVALRADVRTCDGATLLCTFTVSGALTGHDYSGGTVVATGDTASVHGSAAINVHIGCNAAIRAVIFGSTVGVTLSLTAH